MLGLVVLPTLLLSGFGILAIKNERAALEKRLRDTYEERTTRVVQVLLQQISIRDVAGPALEATNRRIRSVVHQIYPEERARFALVPTSLLAARDRSITEMLRELSPNWSAVVEGDPNLVPQPFLNRPLPEPLQDYQLSVYLPEVDPVGAVMLRNTILYSSLMVLFLALVIVGVVITARFIHREVRLSRLQTDFVSNVSHELRTPLTSIRMFIETLQMDRVKDPAEVKECLAIISVESERLTRMIERMLGWARMEAGRRIYTHHSTEVSDVVAAALKAFQTQRIQADLAMEVSIEPGLSPVNVDLEAMSEALLNLLNNALKYTSDPKRIGLKAFALRGQVAIEVSDNGIGIRAKDRKRIFERFYRADALLSRKTEGSGLGLTIVWHIVEAHGGRVQVDSEEGLGSRFTVVLPPAASRKLVG